MANEFTVIVSPKAAKVIEMARNAVSKSPTGVSLVSIKGYTNQQGEVADYVFNLGASYENAKNADIKYLKELDVTKGEWKYDMLTMLAAQTKLLESLVNPSVTRSKGQKDAYINISNGLKVHIETGVLYIYGYRMKKTVITQGNYSSVNSSLLTLAKNELRKQMKTDKFRQFIMAECETFKASGDTLEIK